jgi:NDP-sugar pyrophosphorylase family protein
MKGMVLAAGFGTRMGPITQYLAKPAIPFLGVPMIEHSIGVLRSGGIEDIIINLHHLPETLTELLGDGSKLGVNISYSFEDPILGSGGGIGKARDFLGKDTFIVLNSDIMIECDLSKIIAEHKASEADATLLLNPDPKEQYGKVLVDETGRIRKIEGYPESVDFHGGSRYMFAGLHVIEPVWFDFTPEKPAYESFPEVYGPMIAAGKHINSSILDGRWLDLGTARRLLDVTIEELIGNLIPNKGVVDPSAEITKSILTTSSQVGPDCELEVVICLGQAQIDRDCRLKNCIVCPGATIARGTVAEDVIFYEDKQIAISQVKS